MISEFRIHSPHEEFPQSSNTEVREAVLLCPHCQQPINLSTGLCGRRQVEAVLLQARRIGTELECRRCGLRFVYHQTTPHMNSRLSPVNREWTNTYGAHRESDVSEWEQLAQAGYSPT